jgi:DUF4097 and DUF4098 domain-containing protein YvlB
MANLLPAATETIEKSFQVKPGGNLYLDSDIGSIRVETSGKTLVEVQVIQEFRGWDRDKIDEFLEDFTVEFKQSDNDIEIIGKLRREWKTGWWDDLKVEYIIKVPVQFNVDLNTSGGSISVEDLEGEAEAHTSGGSLSFGNITGKVSGHTSGGSIRLEGSRGDAYLRTSGGSISIGEVEGDVDAKTSGGSVSIRKAAGEVNASTSGGSVTVEEVMGAVDASTSGGSVTAYISKQPQKDCRLKTSGGTVTVYMDEDIAVDLDAKSSSGRVECDFKILIQGRQDEKWLRGEINGGGPELYLRTSGGNIYIEKK